ncbi:hypothetical protein BKA58DRAFT_375602 [Alternaria rosae]|uniref:uncharacterized protein n=1 Tax=Alternaria rosae TaxID=1187941 RepID=UPI001E8EBA22|nr:uncharacterized protein BKA58DRAFT_375602 [Alternaria rosae]KAH6877633.1 hypothetical protein BKA58DRAFT_375602 [Alternaria rosae]
MIVVKSRGWTVPLGNVRRVLQAAPGTSSAKSESAPKYLPAAGSPYSFIHFLHYTSPQDCSPLSFTSPIMYHLDGNPAPSDQTLFQDLLKITTSKWQSMLKRDTTPARQEPASRPSVSRTSTQLSVPISKE